MIAEYGPYKAKSSGRRVFFGHFDGFAPGWPKDTPPLMQTTGPGDVVVKPPDVKSGWKLWEFDGPSPLGRHPRDPQHPLRGKHRG